MSKELKYQSEYASQLAAMWIAGDHEYVRDQIRKCKNKAQASYIAAAIASSLCLDGQEIEGIQFVKFIHPNEGK